MSCRHVKDRDVCNDMMNRFTNGHPLTSALTLTVQATSGWLDLRNLQL